jgi:hypothetical protein
MISRASNGVAGADHESTETIRLILCGAPACERIDFKLPESILNFYVVPP